MKKFFAVALVLSFASVGKTAGADALDDFARDLSSPLTTKAKVMFWSGTVLALTTLAFEDQISDPIQERVSGARPLGEFPALVGHFAGYAAPNFIYFLTMSGLSRWENVPRYQDQANLMARSTLYAQGVTGALKLTVRQTRPDRTDQTESFPSGHTTSAFSFASVIHKEHGNVFGGIAYGYAVLVGFSRMNDNRHYLHDVIAGATVGASYGLGLYYRKEPDGSRDSAFMSLVPTDDLSGAQILISKTF